MLRIFKPTIAIEPLCAYCIKIWTTQGAGPRSENWHPTSSILGWNLGEWSRIQQSQCPFCKLVKGVAHEVYRAGEQVNPHRPDKIISVAFIGVPAPIQRAVFCVEGLSSLASETPAICYVTKSAATTFADDAYFLNLTIPEKLDISRVTTWISKCTTTHSGDCVPIVNKDFSEAFRGLPVIRFIDVFKNCLVETQKVPKYVSLSYMWGTVPNFRLTTSNRSQLFVAGSLEKVQNIPRTIKDAIALVRQLQVRYLWVDALCLLQNDGDDVERGLNAMDLVYEQSWLTIVAACGHNANAGLPGIHPNSRVETTTAVEVKKGVSLGVYSDLELLMRNSVYRSRGWTYQEELLCRRALYFVDNKVFYRCRSAEYSESCLDHPQPQKPQRNDLSPRKNEIPNHGGKYCSLVMDYSKRALSNDRDALRAMSGITQRFSSLLSYDFLEGLPSYILDVCLAFEACQGNSLHRRVGFPSYTWAGWRGALRIRYPGGSEITAVIRHSCWIVWYKRSPSGKISPVRDPENRHWTHFTSGRSFDPPVPLGIDTSRTAPTELSFSPRPLSYHLLQFWTIAIFCKISKYEDFTGNCALVLKDGTKMGPISLDGFEESVFFDSNEPYEFILLSRGERHSEYRVMLIEWIDGIAERRGIGSIPNSIVENSFPPGPVWKEILLG